jgi:peptidoglycan-N-acetylglucosamine deacetylase
MGTFNFPVPPIDRRFSASGRIRTMVVLVLSAFLAILGSITFTTSAYWNKTSSHLNAHPSPSVTRHIAAPTPIPTHISVRKPTLSPTKAPVHAPVLAYPLFYGNTQLPEVALTFDDGPNPYYTPQVLTVLQQYGIKATFFDVGYLVADYPNIVRQEYHQGNLVGNHSWSHPELTLLSATAILSQITSTSNAIKAAIGVRPTFFRPPYGAMNHIVLAEANYLGDTTVLWDASAGDWKLPGVKVIVSTILHYIHNGSIILLHDGGGNRAQTVAALPILITTLENRGYTFVTVQRLVDDLAAPATYSSPSSGTTFSTATITGTVAWRRETLA